MDAPDPAPVVPAPRRPERPVLHNEIRALTETIDRLATRFPLHSSASVSEIVRQAHQGFDGSEMREFIPLLVEREARLRLEHTTTQAASVQEPFPEPTRVDAGSSSVVRPPRSRAG
jgi:hypothetical protein